MPDVNLLPTQLPQDREKLKTAENLKKISLIVGILFAMASVLGIILIIFLSSQVRASLTKQQDLKQKISALEATEQRLFLIKDRIDKIKTVSANKNGADSFILMNKTLSSLPPDVAVDSVEIDTAKAKFSVLGKNSLAMATFLNSLVAGNLYKKLTLTNFLFSPDRGYLITLQII